MSAKTASIKPFELVNFIIALAFMFLFRLIPAPEPITAYGMGVLGVFIGAIWGYCFGGQSTLWASMLALFALGLVMPTGVYGAVAAVLSNYVFIIVFLSLFTVGALMGANISEYLAFKLLSADIFKKNAWLLILGILLCDFIVGIATNPIVVTIFLFSLLTTLFEQAGYKVGEKTPTMILLSVAITTLACSILYPWSAPQVIPLQSLQAVGITVSNGAYMGMIFIATIIVIAICMAMMKLLNCDVKQMSQCDIGFLAEKYKDGLSRYQKAVLVGMLLFALGSIVVAFFPKSLGVVSTVVTSQISFIGWMALAVGVMMFIKVDGKRLLEPNVMAAAFPWDMLMMIGIGVAVGGMLTTEDAGITAWIGEKIGPMMSSTSDLTLCIIIAVIGLVLTNFLNNNAVIILLSTIVVSLSTQGIIDDPVVPSMVVILASEMGFLTPGASVYGAMMHSHEYTTPSSVYKYGGIMFVVTLVFCIVIVVPLSRLFF